MTAIVPATPVAPLAPATVSGAPAVEVRGLNKRYPVRRGWADTLRHPWQREFQTVLHDVTLDVRPGEFFGLLGPNGAGKTTLFKILSSLVLPDSGTVRVVGHDVTREEALTRTLLTPVVADERSLFWRLSARENLRAYAALQGLRGAALQERVDELLQVVELADTGTKMVGQFSSGMKQRLILARALISRPRVLLLDEPTRALDPVSALRFRTFLREELSVRQGCTVLLATHNAEEALELCDRIGVLNRGRLLRVGTPQQLMNEVGDERYRVWIDARDVQLFAGVADGGAAESWSRLPDDESGWAVMEMEVRGGLDRAADLNAALVRRGIRVARLEPVRLSLAGLIERVVARQEVPHGSVS